MLRFVDVSYSISQRFSLFEFLLFFGFRRKGCFGFVFLPFAGCAHKSMFFFFVDHSSNNLSECAPVASLL